MNKNHRLYFFLLLWVSACSHYESSDLVVEEMKATEALMKRPRLEKQNTTQEQAIKQRDSSQANPVINHPKRFNIAVNAIPAKLFFMNLMAGTKTNIVVHPDIDGEITLNLQQVTIGDVLDTVREIYGYDYKQRNRIYTIYAKKLRTKIYPIDYIDVERVGVSDTSVLTGNVESSDQSEEQNEQSDQRADLLGSGSAIVPGSRVQTRSETDFWLSLQQAVSEIIGVGRNTDQFERRVIANPQTGVVVVTAMPDELIAVGQFLEKAQLSITRQVIIEAKILEVELNEAYEAGINWDEINGQLLLTNNVTAFSPPTTITEFADGAGQVFSSLVRVSDIGRLLSLLETQGEIQVLSSPRVSTVNNQKAVIRVGFDRFFVTGISNTTTTSSGSTTNNPDVELSSFFSGISLDVTPQIADNGSVILHIHPVVSSVSEEQKNITVGDNQFSLPLPLRDIRESDSIVHAENGQVVVLGGLMQERLVNVSGKRPGFSDVPIISRLFKKDSRSKNKSELIILLKPVVVDQNEWLQAFVDSKNRVQQWENGSRKQR